LAAPVVAGQSPAPVGVVAFFPATAMGLFMGAVGVPASAVACDTTTQLPNPPPEMNCARHKLPSGPPVHFVPGGSEATIIVDCDPEGELLPFMLMVIGTKFLPVPVASTLPINFREPSVPPLKLKAMSWKDPFAFAMTGDADFIAEAILVTAGPHGVVAPGRWASARTAVPLTPNAGVTMAWEVT